jgi:hypothetical protein
MVCSCCVVQKSRAISAVGCTVQKTWRSACAKPGNTGETGGQEPPASNDYNRMIPAKQTELVEEAIDITCEDNCMIKTQITLILDSRIFLMW